MHPQGILSAAAPTMCAHACGHLPRAPARPPASLTTCHVHCLPPDPCPAAHAQPARLLHPAQLLHCLAAAAAQHHPVRGRQLHLSCPERHAAWGEQRAMQVAACAAGAAGATEHGLICQPMFPPAASCHPTHSHRPCTHPAHRRLSLTAERWEDDSQAVYLRMAVAGGQDAGAAAQGRQGLQEGAGAAAEGVACPAPAAGQARTPSCAAFCWRLPAPAQLCATPLCQSAGWRPECLQLAPAPQP